MIWRSRVSGMVVTSDKRLGYPYELQDGPAVEVPYFELHEDVAVAVPTGTVAGILAEVGSDPVRADVALLWELAQDRPRSTLVAALKRILGDESR